MMWNVSQVQCVSKGLLSPFLCVVRLRCEYHNGNVLARSVNALSLSLHHPTEGI